jgi:hypothetical protein
MEGRKEGLHKGKGDCMNEMEDYMKEGRKDFIKNGGKERRKERRKQGRTDGREEGRTNHSGRLQISRDTVRGN